MAMSYKTPPSTARVASGSKKVVPRVRRADHVGEEDRDDLEHLLRARSGRRPPAGPKRAASGSVSSAGVARTAHTRSLPTIRSKQSPFYFSILYLGDLTGWGPRELGDAASAADWPAGAMTCLHRGAQSALGGSTRPGAAHMADAPLRAAPGWQDLGEAGTRKGRYVTHTAGRAAPGDTAVALGLRGLVGRGLRRHRVRLSVPSIRWLEGPVASGSVSGRQAHGGAFACDRLHIEHGAIQGQPEGIENFVLEPALKALRSTARLGSYTYTATLFAFQVGRASSVSAPS